MPPAQDQTSSGGRQGPGCLGASLCLPGVLEGLPGLYQLTNLCVHTNSHGCCARWYDSHAFKPTTPCCMTGVQVLLPPPHQWGRAAALLPPGVVGGSQRAMHRQQVQVMQVLFMLGRMPLPATGSRGPSGVCSPGRLCRRSSSSLSFARTVFEIAVVALGQVLVTCRAGPLLPPLGQLIPRGELRCTAMTCAMRL
jgi:hypothetical protein